MALPEALLGMECNWLEKVGCEDQHGTGSTVNLSGAMAMWLVVCVGRCCAAC